MKRMLVILVLALAASSPALSQGKDGGDQKAQEVSVQISSIPAGLNLYVASADDKALAQAESKTRDMLTKESYLRGATPARLSLAPGKYYVTVAPVLGLPERSDLMLICEDPALKREEYLVVSHQPTIDAIKTDPKGKPVVGLKSFAAPLYSFEITPDGPEYITILAVPKTLSLTERASFYPREASFDVDEKEVSDWIESNLRSVSRGDRKVAVDLLRRGGKVVVRMPFRGLGGGGGVATLQLVATLYVTGKNKWEQKLAAEEPGQ
jgi:hypothetical protein